MINKRIFQIVYAYLILASISPSIFNISPILAKKVSKSKKFVACRLPAIKNGRIKIRNSGRKIKYKCFKPSKLVGASIASCISGKWVPYQLPVCAKLGCGSIEGTKDNNFSIISGYAETLASGAFVKFHCHSGHHMQGVQDVYCDGFHWSSAAPSCLSLRKPPNLVIDFDDCLKISNSR